MQHKTSIPSQSAHDFDLEGDYRKFLNCTGTVGGFAFT
jgi:hypothetical protein